MTKITEVMFLIKIAAYMRKMEASCVLVRDPSEKLTGSERGLGGLIYFLFILTVTVNFLLLAVKCPPPPPPPPPSRPSFIVYL